MSTTFSIEVFQAAALTGAFAIATLSTHRWAARRIAGGRIVLTPTERRRLGWARAAATTALLSAVSVLWWAELQAAMLSLTAVLVALVLASKELIQCATGSLLGGLRGGLRIGDRVAVAGVEGEVVERTILTTTLVELGSGTFGYEATGRTLVVPNLQLFAGVLRRRRQGRDFVFHRIEITIDRCAGTAEALHVWRSETARQIEPFAARAAEARRAIEAEIGASLGGTAARTRLSTTELGKIRLDAEIFCPADQAAALEARLVTNFLDWLAARAAIAGFARRFDGANGNATSREAHAGRDEAVGIAA